MKASRLFGVGAVLGSFTWMLAGGCSGDSKDNAGNGNNGGSMAQSDAATDATEIVPGTGGTGGSSGVALNVLCGDGKAQCLPDDQQACRGYQPPSEVPSMGGGGSESGAGGEAGFAAGGLGQGGSPDEPGGGVGGQASGGAAQGGNSAGGAASGGAGGEGGSNDPEPAVTYGCQVTRLGNQLERQCQLAGVGDINAPCFSAADCQAGLACVTEGEAGRCLRYCCAGDGTCRPGTYCADQPLRKLTSDTSNTEPPRVPVCVPADDCSLEDTFPCPEGTACRCQGNTACLVVRADGTTTCRVPGTGKQGEACPCAWNHVCSSVTQKCVKICNTDPAKDECAPQKCQASSELPQNFGVCVGPL